MSAALLPELALSAGRAHLAVGEAVLAIWRKVQADAARGMNAVRAKELVAGIEPSLSAWYDATLALRAAMTTDEGRQALSPILDELRDARDEARGLLELFNRPRPPADPEQRRLARAAFERGEFRNIPDVLRERGFPFEE